MPYWTHQLETYLEIFKKAGTQGVHRAFRGRLEHRFVHKARQRCVHRNTSSMQMYNEVRLCVVTISRYTNSMIFPRRKKSNGVRSGYRRTGPLHPIQHQGVPHPANHERKHKNAPELYHKPSFFIAYRIFLVKCRPYVL
ncbi:hypothetical protein TNCV_4577531 [Trichonephila clavipes]|nr:hypothetical protein TNCV_4577531 [Trichonephila clavipes]